MSCTLSMHTKNVRSMQNYLYLCTSKDTWRGTSPCLNTSMNGVLLYLCVLLIAQSADIECNPGPSRKCKFPGGVHKRGVRNQPNRQAICCNNCSIWYHKDCIDMSTSSHISKITACNNMSWICCKCDTPNYWQWLSNKCQLALVNRYNHSVQLLTIWAKTTRSLVSVPFIVPMLDSHLHHIRKGQ